MFLYQEPRKPSVILILKPAFFQKSKMKLGSFEQGAGYWFLEERERKKPLYKKVGGKKKRGGENGVQNLIDWKVAKTNWFKEHESQYISTMNLKGSCIAWTNQWLQYIAERIHIFLLRERFKSCVVSSIVTFSWFPILFDLKCQHSV